MKGKDSTRGAKIPALPSAPFLIFFFFQVLYKKSVTEGNLPDSRWGPGQGSEQLLPRWVRGMILASRISSPMSPQPKKRVYIYNGEKEEMSRVSWGRKLGPALPGLEEQPTGVSSWPSGVTGPSPKLPPLFQCPEDRGGTKSNRNESEERLGRSMLAV